MVEIEQIRSFFFKLFIGILIFCICQILLELSNVLIAEVEEARFKRSIDDHDGSVESTKEMLINLPGQQTNDQFIRKKRLNNATKKFIATDEWQEINSDHLVPSGLHYRINLETGKKEAKLLNKNKNKSKELLVMKNNQKDVHQHEINKLDELKPVDRLNKEFDKFKFAEKDVDLSKDKNLNEWRSMDEIKKEFENLNIKLSTDSENVQTLLNRYKKASKIDEKITILNDLEFILHQYDVSADFIKMNGLEVLKDDFLTNSNVELQKLICIVIGSAASSHPQVKVAIIKSGLFDNLIIKLNTEKDLKLNLKTVFALSSILRQFPFSQQKFIEKDGLKIMRKKFFIDDSTDSEKDNKTNSILIKIQTKIISLLSDLIDEYRFVVDEMNLLNKKNETAKSNEYKNLEEKMKQYNMVNLEQNFVNEGFCSIIPRNLTTNKSADVQEKVLKSMYSFRSVCKTDFKMYLTELVKIKHEFQQKIINDKQNDETDDDDYYQNLIQITQNLIDYLND